MKENDIRPDDLMKMEAEAAKEDIAFLLSEKASWERVLCPACNQDDFSQYGIKDEIVYVECRNCKTISINPRPSEALLHRYYETSKAYKIWNDHIFPASDAARRKNIYQPRANALIARCRESGIGEGASFLELGAGFGSFCDVVREQRFFGSITAVEPTPKLAEHCRSLGLDVISDFAENTVHTGTYDVVCAFEVIEHVYCPWEFVKNAAAVLAPNGLLILSCPNPRGFDLSVLGLKSQNFAHGHLNYFHPRSIRLLLERAGFRSIEVTTPGKLDVELVRNIMQTDRGLPENIPGSSFLEDLLFETDETTRNDFQCLLAANGLSSHMVVTAKK